MVTLVRSERLTSPTGDGIERIPIGMVRAPGVRELPPGQQLVEVLLGPFIALTFRDLERFASDTERRHMAEVQVGRHATHPVAQRIIAGAVVVSQTLGLEGVPACIARTAAASSVRHGGDAMVDAARRDQLGDRALQLVVGEMGQPYGLKGQLGHEGNAGRAIT